MWIMPDQLPGHKQWKAPRPAFDIVYALNISFSF